MACPVCSPGGVQIMKGDTKMLFEIRYHGYTDYFLADNWKQAEERARLLSCGGSFVLTLIPEYYV